MTLTHCSGRGEEVGYDYRGMIMVATNFNTENRTYRQLLGNGLTYSIPRFQRDYSWSEEEWEDLWTDMTGMLSADGEQAHYMGYLVLQTANNRNFDVIDGQQRLTTLSLIVLGAMRLLKKYAAEGRNADANQRRLDQLRLSYVGQLDPVTLTTNNKLSLNRNNDSYYRDYLVSIQDSLPSRGFHSSTHVMRKGFEWFERHLQDHVKADPDPGMALARFVETISDRLFFTVITVADELNAYKVFETLNARGVRLSTTDLLKNYLFSVLARQGDVKQEMDEMERRWENMVGRLANESFPDFLRMHWNSRNTFVRQSELFKAITKHVRDRASIFKLLRDMDEDIDVYLALTAPEASQWPQGWKQSALELRMFSVRQPFPMLMAAKRSFSDEDAFGDLLRAVTVIAFRYNIIRGQQTGEQEVVYNSAARQIHQGKIGSFGEVLESLRSIYIPDKNFRADFSEKSIKTTQSRNAKIVRYILFKLERQNSGMEFDPESSLYTIEHIFPRNPEVGWDDFYDRDLDEFIFRLGNMVMLETGKNKSLGNRAYDVKRSVLQNSAIGLTQRLANENGEWTPERLAAWQQGLAGLATSVWRIAQLS